MERLLRIQSDTASQCAGQQPKRFINRRGSALLTLSERGRRSQRCISSAAVNGDRTKHYSLPSDSYRHSLEYRSHLLAKYIDD